MLASRNEIARLQSDFFRDKYRKTLRWLLLSVFVIYLLIAVIIYVILFRPPQHYYANTTDGRIIPMIQTIG